VGDGHGPRVASSDVPGLMHRSREMATDPRIAVPDAPGLTRGSSAAESILISSSRFNPVHDLQSGASVPGPSSSSIDSFARHGTRLQHGISKPKVCTDGTVRYSLFSASGEPQHHNEAMCDERWKKAMDNKFDALFKKESWHLVPPKAGGNIIDCKWVYKIKRKFDGSIDRYKARLVAKWFKQ
jgi:hypothetical protein